MSTTNQIEHIGHDAACQVDGKRPNKICTCGAEKRAREADRAEREQPSSKDLLAELHRWHSLKGASCFRDAADEIERLRMAERMNVETVATFQKRIDFLERTIELVADGLAGVRNASDEDAVDVLRAALDGRVGQPPPDVRALFNKGVGVQKENRFSFGFETVEEAERAFHYIADLGTLETSRPPSTKSDSFANAPLTGPGSRLEADLRAMGAGETGESR
jgi:hypothetical protein